MWNGSHEVLPFTQFIFFLAASYINPLVCELIIPSLLIQKRLYSTLYMHVSRGTNIDVQGRQLITCAGCNTDIC